MKNILAVQPPGYFQLPPLGLLKLAQYRRSKGDDIRLIMPNIKVNKKGKLKAESRKKQVQQVMYDINSLKQEPDMAYVTSLFTWDWEHVHNVVSWIRRKFPKCTIYLGGIYATLMPDHAKQSGARVKTGLMLGAEKTMPAYDLIPEWTASIGFSSRGCTNNCAFCAVPRLEKSYQAEKSIKHFLYPGHKGVILLDNNFLASPYWYDVLQEIMEEKRWVDFNQGLDFRILELDQAKELMNVKKRGSVLHTAMDEVSDIPYLQDAVQMFKDLGMKHTKYIIACMLYNFTDTPDDFLERLKAAMEMGITLFPMRYQSMRGETALVKDSFISSNWTTKQLELVKKASRILGFHGSFVPQHEWFVNQVKNASTLEEALLYKKIDHDQEPLQSFLGE